MKYFKTPRLFFFACLFISTPVFIPAMDWPSADAVMTGNFASNNAGKPQFGLSFSGEGDLYPVETGEIIFARRDDDKTSKLPAPLGSWVALDHGNGLIGVYGRLSLKNMNSKMNGQVTKNTVLAQSGKTGWTAGSGFYFSFFDRKERQWVNPQLILPPHPDTLPPGIKSVVLRAVNGEVINLWQGRAIKQGRYTICVDAEDRRLEAGPPLAPFRMVSSVNGVEAGVLAFETFQGRDGILMVYRNGLVPVQQIYAPHPAFEAGEMWFTRGQATLDIIVSDIAGNSRTASYRLLVE
jgi:hypothetical protein